MNTIRERLSAVYPGTSVGPGHNFSMTDMSNHVSSTDDLSFLAIDGYDPESSIPRELWFISLTGPSSEPFSRQTWFVSKAFALGGGAPCTTVFQKDQVTANG